MKRALYVFACGCALRPHGTRTGAAILYVTVIYEKSPVCHRHFTRRALYVVARGCAPRPHATTLYMEQLCMLPLLHETSPISHRYFTKREPHVLSLAVAHRDLMELTLVCVAYSYVLQHSFPCVIMTRGTCAGVT